MHRIGSLLMIWGLLCGALACNVTESLSDCQGDQDCPSWQLCHPQDQYCVRRAGLLDCDPSQEEACGVGATCDPAGHFCQPLEDLTFGASLELSHESDAVQRRIHTTREMLYYTLGQINLEQHSATGRRFQLEVLDNRDFEEGRRETLTQLMEQRVAVLMTTTNATAEIAGELAEPNKLLQLNVYNRGASLVLEELEQTLPSLDTRYNFSLVPIPYIDFATWSRYIAQEGQCASVTLVHTNDSTNQLSARLFHQEMPRHGVCLRDPIPIPEALQPSYEDVLETLGQRGADCVYLRSSAEVAEAIWRQWADQCYGSDAPCSQIRWLLGKSLYLGALEPSPQAQELYSAMRGALVLSYPLDHPTVDQFLREFLPIYEQIHARLCPPELPEGDCKLMPPEELPEGSNPLRIAYNYDQAMLAILSWERAWLRDEDGVITRQELRDSLLKITAVGPEHGVCSYPDVGDCFLRLSTGKEIHYSGISGPLIFGADARPVSLHESMLFQNLESNGRLTDLMYYPQKEMVASWEADFVGARCQ